MERAQIVVDGPNPPAVASLVLGIVAILTTPAVIVASQHSKRLTLHWAIAAGGALAGLLAVGALVLARRGRLRAERSIDGGGSRAAGTGRLLGTLALCTGIAAGLALATDAFLTHFQK